MCKHLRHFYKQFQVKHSNDSIYTYNTHNALCVHRLNLHDNQFPNQNIFPTNGIHQEPPELA